MYGYVTLNHGRKYRGRIIVMNIIKAMLPDMRINRYVNNKYGIKFNFVDKGRYGRSMLVCESKEIGTSMIIINNDKLESIKEGKEVYYEDNK